MLGTSGTTAPAKVRQCFDLVEMFAPRRGGASEVPAPLPCVARGGAPDGGPDGGPDRARERARGQGGSHLRRPAAHGGGGGGCGVPLRGAARGAQELGRRRRAGGPRADAAAAASSAIIAASGRASLRAQGPLQAEARGVGLQLSRLRLKVVWERGEAWEGEKPRGECGRGFLRAWWPCQTRYLRKQIRAVPKALSLRCLRCSVNFGPPLGLFHLGAPPRPWPCAPSAA